MRIFAASAPGPHDAIRYLYISSGSSSKPHAFWSGVPPPMYSWPLACAEVPPPCHARSSTSTEAPAARASSAAQTPAPPAPTITTSASRSQCFTSPASRGWDGFAVCASATVFLARVGRRFVCPPSGFGVLRGGEERRALAAAVHEHGRAGDVRRERRGQERAHVADLARARQAPGGHR